MFGLKDAEIVALVAECGGFRAASARLGVAPSAISARVGQVERALGAALFDRSRRGVRLTPVGRRFVEQSKRLVSLRDTIMADLAASNELSGVLRIGVAETIVHTCLPDLVRALAEAAPRVRLELSVDVSEQLNRALLDDAIDVALMMRQWTPPDAVTAAIDEVEIDWFAAPRLIARWSSEAAPSDPAPLDLASLDDIAVITFSKGTPPAREVARIFDDPRLPDPVIHGSSTLATILRLTRDGFGVGTLPKTFAASDIATGDLAAVDLGRAARLSPLGFDLCYLSPSVAPFAEILLKGARKRV